MTTFRAIADHALLIEIGDKITDDTYAAVLALDRALAATPFPGFREAVPAYVNLLVEFDPLITDHEHARAHIERLLVDARPEPIVGTDREVLICYDDPYAPDLAEVARRTGLDREAVIAGHLAGDYRVFMYGFAPGYAYLAGVPERIQLPRKPSPVRNVPAGSMAIAGPQCIVSTLVMPTGWWVIGRSPTRILTGEENRPFLFDVGDRVIFRRITRQQLEEQK